MRRTSLSVIVWLAAAAAAFAVADTDPGDTLASLPPMAAQTVLFDSEVRFGYRGKAGIYAMPPSVAGVYFDEHVRCEDADRSPPSPRAPAEPPAFVIQRLDEAVTASSNDVVEGTVVQNGRETALPGESTCVMYDLREGLTFCGAYLILFADLTGYPCLSFQIRGEHGGETFEIAMNDAISNKREDAVIVGSIYRYLPGGVTTNWQRVVIPLEDFYGAELSRVFSLVFICNEPGRGRYWVDNLRFHKTQLVDRPGEIARAGRLLLDDFDHSDVNLLGRKCGSYKKAPSLCAQARLPDPTRPGARVLRLRYDKKATGWCGYYSLLNEIDGRYYDLTGFDTLSFFVRGERGGEQFEMGMADRNWVNIGDSLKAGSIDRYLPGGVSTNWQRVTIPLKDFGLLDFAEMGSFCINFTEKASGAIYLDDLELGLKETSRDKTP